MKRIALSVCLAALLIGLAPLISALSAGLIANAFGCDLDEGSIHACMALGADIGPTLYTMFVLGWLGLLILGIISLIQKLRR